ncbi:lipid II:glycine glycyltransferase (peptidoglycan interpeptide bridge formation enzyme) [Arcanobacterium pluranimalium]|uniref:lipid II:glycine glycyltransferase FemX n=1 Tax=Arcanobacterium pluranimalium TaxID=108028 RepID=UPI0019564B85|nr:peptidoglycan bridge formation glycyltransferase FemA/FemB family protein [Arcanobacterium pluranimalium]MBM7824229.1 lipid II:glycine glycyltransferase (peptidoglycan interpeptide bridge formation enzyme) [Arcanobacterium pluranimalium]
MILDVTNKPSVEKFDTFLAHSPHATILQTRNWAKVKDNWQSHHLYIERDGEIQAAISLLSIFDQRAGGYFFYAPRGPVCDLYDVDTVTELFAEVTDYVREHEGFVARIDPEVPYDAELVEKYAAAGYTFTQDPKNTTQPLQSLVLNIGGRSGEEILTGLSRGTRKTVRRSYRLGISNKVGTRADLPEFYRILEIMNKHHGLSYRPYEYFEKLYDAFPNNTRLSFSMYDGEAIATSFLITFGKRAFSIYGADTHEYNLGQSYQINYEEICYAAQAGCDYYDMGGIFSTDEDDGLYQFKKKFTEDNVVSWIGNLDIVIDPDTYGHFIKK